MPNNNRSKSHAQLEIDAIDPNFTSFQRAKAQEELDWRVAREAWNEADKAAMIAGPGSNPLPPPPPPPGV